MRAVGHFGKNLSSLSDKMNSTVRNRLADLKAIIIDEISMVSNNLLFFNNLRLNEIFATTNIESFAGLTIVAVGDSFNYHLLVDSQSMQSTKKSVKD